MPVFFYIDPAILDDPSMANVRSVTLNYTFFKTGEMGAMDIGAEFAKREAAVAAARAGLQRLRAAPAPAGAGAGAGADDAAAAQSSESQDAVKAWTAEVAARIGGGVAAAAASKP
jgi:hypothetical protein